ncbi:MAG: class I SAM-dependent methyltransferase [Phycisphaerae bacterium]
MPSPLPSVAHGLAPARPAPPVELHPLPGCPLCDADDPAPLFLGHDHQFGFAGEFPVVRCRACGLVYNAPRLAPAALDAYFPADYAAHAPDYGRNRRATPRSRDPWDAVAPFGQRRLLDLGCGAGAYLERMARAGWTALGIDPVAAAVDACRARGLNARRGAIPGVDLADQRFELITLLGALGALPEPRATLATLRRHVTSDGLLILNAFNSAGWFARLAGPLWIGYDLPRQCCHYSPTTLAALLDRTGWRVERLAFRRRPNIGRRTARLAALATGRLGWRVLAAQRWATGLVSTVARFAGQSDDLVVVARPA